jgi:hypothetical protein
MRVDQGGREATGTSAKQRFGDQKYDLVAENPEPSPIHRQGLEPKS